jgi:hypothetical protein
MVVITIPPLFAPQSGVEVRTVDHPEPGRPAADGLMDTPGIMKVGRHASKIPSGNLT